MAQKFLVNADLNQNQIINAKFEVLASDPSTGNFAGRMIYNSTANTIKVHTGSAWRTMLHAVSSAGTYSAALTISESNGAISITPNLADGTNAGLLSNTLYTRLNNATASATASTLALRDSNGNISVATPTNDAHAVTKAYVDAIRLGLDVKESVRAASPTSGGNITVTYTAGGGTSGRGQITAAPNTLDGVTLAANNRILLKDQSTGAQNGIWVVTTVGTGSNGVWDRATDFDSDAEVTSGAFVFVEEGSAHADSGWVLTTNDPIQIGGSPGATNINFAQFSGAGQITAGAGLTKSGNTLDVGAGTGITVNADTVQISATYVGQTSITTLGTIATGTWNADAILLAKGGTGLTSIAQHEMLSGPSSGTALTKISAPTQGGQTLRYASGGGGSISWGALDLANTFAVTGVLTATNGGTGLSSLGTGVSTWLGTPSSANLRSAVTDETGTGGGLVFATGPTLSLPAMENIKLGYTTTVMSSTAVTLTSSSNHYQYFTGGGTDQIVYLPSTTTLANGQSFFIVNEYTGNTNLLPSAVYVRLSGGAAAIVVVPPLKSAIFTCIDNTTNANASWDVQLLPGGTASGGSDTTYQSGAKIYTVGCSADVSGVSTTSVTHSFGTSNVNVQIMEVSTGNVVIGDISSRNPNTLTVTLNGTISANDYRIICTA